MRASGHAGREAAHAIAISDGHWREKSVCECFRRLPRPAGTGYVSPAAETSGDAGCLLVQDTVARNCQFPKEGPAPRRAHNHAAERQAKLVAGPMGVSRPRHFHIYVDSKGVFWKAGGVHEYVVKGFLMKVRQTR